MNMMMTVDAEHPDRNRHIREEYTRHSDHKDIQVWSDEQNQG